MTKDWSFQLNGWEFQDGIFKLWMHWLHYLALGRYFLARENSSLTVG